MARRNAEFGNPIFKPMSEVILHGGRITPLLNAIKRKI
jgi:hypothetical protein